MRKEGLDRVRERHHVRVPYDDELGPRIHVFECNLQRAALETVTTLSMDDLEARAPAPRLEDRRALVRGIVDDDHLVAPVLERRAPFEKAVDDALFVVGRDVYRDEGFIAKLEMTVAVAVAVGVTVAVATEKPHEPVWMAVAIRVSVAVRQQH